MIYDLKRWRFLAALALLLLPGPAPAAALAMPFGLEDLQPGMSSEDAMRVLRRWPKLPAPPRGSAAMTDEGTGYAGPFAWRDCTFDISLYFTRHAGNENATLDTILLQSPRRAGSRCLTQMNAELAARYGAGMPDTKLVPVGRGEGLQWKTPDATIRFAHASEPPPFHLLYSQFDITAQNTGTLVAITASAPSTITIYDVVERAPPEPDLTFGLAMAGAQAALQACRREKIPAAVGVFSLHGELLVLLQDDDIRSYEAPEHVRDKAYAVFLTDRPSRAYEKTLETGDKGKLQRETFEHHYFHQAKPLLDAVPMAKAGALPVVIGNHYVGVVSVDGGWDYAHNVDDEAWDGDEGCARVGVAAIQRLWPK